MTQGCLAFNRIVTPVLQQFALVTAFLLSNHDKLPRFYSCNDSNEKRFKCFVSMRSWDINKMTKEASPTAAFFPDNNPGWNCHANHFSIFGMWAPVFFYFLSVIYLFYLYFCSLLPTTATSIFPVSRLLRFGSQPNVFTQQQVVAATIFAVLKCRLRDTSKDTKNKSLCLVVPDMGCDMMQYNGTGTNRTSNLRCENTLYGWCFGHQIQVSIHVYQFLRFQPRCHHANRIWLQPHSSLALKWHRTTKQDLVLALSMNSSQRNRSMFAPDVREWPGASHRTTGVTGPDNDQDQTMTTPFGRCVVLKFQDQTMTT